MRRTKETKSGITIPEDWIKEIESKSRSKQIPEDKKNQIDAFIKKYYPKYPQQSIAEICGVSRDFISRRIKKIL
jgi:hypothetical protein